MWVKFLFLQLVALQGHLSSFVTNKIVVDRGTLPNVAMNMEIIHDGDKPSKQGKQLIIEKEKERNYLFFFPNPMDVEFCIFAVWSNGKFGSNARDDPFLKADEETEITSKTFSESNQGKVRIFNMEIEFYQIAIRCERSPNQKLMSS
jgi:hypothetical protein